MAKTDKIKYKRSKFYKSSSKRPLLLLLLIRGKTKMMSKVAARRAYTTVSATIAALSSMTSATISSL